MRNKKRGRNAQVSMEFLMIVGIALLMTLPLIIIFFQQSENLNTEISASQLDKIANELRDAADEVYYLGAPSMKTLTIYLPEGVKSITIKDNKIVFKIESPGEDYELVKWSVANFTSDSNLKTYQGIHHVSVQAYDTGVKISD